MARQGADLAELEAAVEVLAQQETLEDKYRDHALIGNWRGYRDCHIRPDWLLLYRVIDDELQLVRTGSHADLFGR
jgi:mRNA interferase YafQ